MYPCEACVAAVPSSMPPPYPRWVWPSAGRGAVLLRAQPVDGPLEPRGVGPGVGELVLQSEDDLGGGERVSLVEQGAQAGGERELRAGVAAVTAGGAVRP